MNTFETLETGPSSQSEEADLEAPDSGLFVVKAS